MKLGVISDIHSNVVVLEKVLNDLEKRKVEKIICCGDYIGLGPWPDEAVQLLMKYEDKLIAVRGNHEKYFLQGIPTRVHDEKMKLGDEQINCHKWTHNKISQSSKEFLERMPIEQNIQIENKKIYIVHYPIQEDGKYRKYINKANINEIKELFSYTDADIYFYGHTHVEDINNENGKWYINPGSLGCPKATNIGKYGILTIENDEVSYESLSIEYDSKEIVKKIEEEKFPFYKKILMLFYGVNENLVQMLGENVTVENIKNEDIPCGEIDLNNDKIKTYIIDKCDSNVFKGKIVSMITLENEKRFIVASRDTDLDYTSITGYFQNIDELKNAKFRSLYEKSAGAIVFKKENGKTYYLIIYSKKDIAGFPKGHIENGESEEEAARREIFEEVGLKVELKKDFKESIHYKIDDTPANKEVVFFLSEMPKNSQIVIDENEINKYEFLDFDDAKKVLRDNVIEVLEKADKKTRK